MTKQDRDKLRAECAPNYRYDVRDTQVVELLDQIDELGKNVEELEADLTNERRISYARGRRIVHLQVQTNEARGIIKYLADMAGDRGFAYLPADKWLKENAE